MVALLLPGISTCPTARGLVHGAAMARGKKRGVDEAVQKVGGVIDASAAGRVTTTAVYRWLRVGRIRDAKSLLLLAEKAEPNDPRARWALARRLAGFDD